MNWSAIRKGLTSAASILLLTFLGCAEGVDGDDFVPSPCTVSAEELFPLDAQAGYRCRGLETPIDGEMLLTEWTDAFDFAAAPQVVIVEFDPGGGTITCNYTAGNAGCIGANLSFFPIEGDPGNDLQCPGLLDPPFRSGGATGGGGLVPVGDVSIIDPNLLFTANVEPNSFVMDSVICEAQ